MRNPAISVSTTVYSWMLRWYPPALRTEYGNDMTDVFAESLAWRGVIRAWIPVVHDFFEIVLPYCLLRAAPVVLALVCSAAFYASMLAAINPNRHCMK